jgi:MscS family membrane protein
LRWTRREEFPWAYFRPAAVMQIVVKGELLAHARYVAYAVKAREESYPRIAALAIALAAQETIANMIGGFVIMTDRPFRVGDRIKLPTGEIGDVQEIGIRSTRVLDFDNNLMVYPNAELIKGKIVNYSYPSEHIRIFVDASVAYETDIDRVRAIMLRLAQEHPDVLKSPPPSVVLVSFSESSLNLQLNGRTNDYRNKSSIETSIREQIYKAFLDEKIQIALPQRVVHLSSPLNVTR